MDLLQSFSCRTTCSQETESGKSKIYNIKIGRCRGRQGLKVANLRKSCKAQQRWHNLLKYHGSTCMKVLRDYCKYSQHGTLANRMLGIEDSILKRRKQWRMLCLTGDSKQ